MLPDRYCYEFVLEIEEFFFFVYLNVMHQNHKNYGLYTVTLCDLSTTSTTWYDELLRQNENSGSRKFTNPSILKCASSLNNIYL